MNTSALHFRPLAVIAALTVSSLLGACSISITAPARDSNDSAGRMKLSTSGNTRFECVQSPTGECHYALYTSRCQTASGEGGKPATTCTHQVFEEFTLAQGQTRDMRDLPSSYKQCMAVKSKPNVPNCD